MNQVQGSVVAVSFDFGETLASLDTQMLARRIAERGGDVSPERIHESLGGAWRAYDAAIRDGAGGHPWKLLMRRLLEASGVAAPLIGETVDWLWTQQPERNLWRRPVPGMLELVRDLGRAGVPAAVLSNSEGRLAELVAELGWRSHFVAIADSGKLGVEKPDRAIFEWVADRLGAPLEAVVHVGDSYEADVLGAVAAGMRAVWFTSRIGAADDRLPAGVTLCRDADELRACLGDLGLQLRPTLPAPLA